MGNSKVLREERSREGSPYPDSLKEHEDQKRKVPKMTHALTPDNQSQSTELAKTSIDRSLAQIQQDKTLSDDAKINRIIHATGVAGGIIAYSG